MAFTNVRIVEAKGGSLLALHVKALGKYDYWIRLNQKSKHCFPKEHIRFSRECVPLSLDVRILMEHQNYSLLSVSSLRFVAFGGCSIQPWSIIILAPDCTYFPISTINRPCITPRSRLPLSDAALA